jgi:hypothetical protein
LARDVKKVSVIHKGGAVGSVVRYDV